MIQHIYKPEKSLIDIMVKGYMSNLDKVTFTLVIVGALNWGLIGLFGFNLVSTIFGTGVVERVVYSIVGVSAGIVGFKRFWG